MKNILFVVATIVIITATGGCKPEKDTLGCYISTPVAPEMRDYIFAPGSYWVYKNDSISAYDTIAVLEVKDTIVKNMISGTSYQYVRTRLYRSSSSKSFSERYGEDFLLRTDDFELGTSCQLDTLLWGTHCQQGVFRCYDIPYSNESFAYIGYFPVMNIEGANYVGVRKCWGKGAAYNSSCSPWDVTTFYSPNSGLIKFTETDTGGYVHSYSLIEKNVTRYEISNPCNL